jgi:lambda repressor-like predicted transcriptional regulator
MKVVKGTVHIFNKDGEDIVRDFVCFRDNIAYFSLINLDRGFFTVYLKDSDTGYRVISDDLKKLYQQNFIGSRIRELRKEKGISLRNLAKVIGVSASFLSEVENNKKKTNKIEAIALVLGVEPSEIYNPTII